MGTLPALIMGLKGAFASCKLHIAPIYSLICAPTMVIEQLTMGCGYKRAMNWPGATCTNDPST